ncbi:hypothetical protein MMC20_002367 [Loxospora ochrophaea]|nr:hypothetical protein [Loxospora ochrophaea]
MTSGFPYKKVLVVGATSGIGEALAERMIDNGISVIAVGRRQERIDAFVEKYGKEKASGISFDLTARDKIPDFVTTVVERNPDLDCIFLNSGIQRGINFAEPESVDLDMIETEFSTNYLSQVAMTKAFLPFLQTKKGKAALM